MNLIEVGTDSRNAFQVKCIHCPKRGMSNQWQWFADTEGKAFEAYFCSMECARKYQKANRQPIDLTPVETARAAVRAYALTQDAHDPDDFDVWEAAYAWAIMNHGGQFSDGYKFHCSIDFHPGPMWSESEVEKENFHYSEVASILERILK